MYCLIQGVSFVADVFEREEMMIELLHIANIHALQVCNKLVSKYMFMSELYLDVVCGESKISLYSFKSYAC